MSNETASKVIKVYFLLYKMWVVDKLSIPNG